MGPLKIVSFGAICILLCFLFVRPIVTEEEPDCLYNQCEWKFKKTFLWHSPCAGTGDRILVRDVECTDGNTIHICCKSQIREDIQKSRQKWFRAVTKIGDKLSRSCTLRILCEQSCLDGLKGSARSDYPQILDGDTEADREYVRAYGYGENLACYDLQAKDNKASNSEPVSPEGCKADCAKKYANCQADLDTNFAVETYYTSARLFHKLGLWFFSAFHMTYDRVRDCSTKAVTILQTIRKAFTDLYERMLTMEKGYQEWKTKSLEKPKRSVDLELELEKQWKQFLISFNQTDAELVDNVYESLNRSEFTNAIATINHTLVTTDFGPGQWNGVVNSRIQWSTMLLIIFAVIICNHKYLNSNQFSFICP